MDEYFVTNKKNRVWLVCKYRNGLNYPDWTIEVNQEEKVTPEKQYGPEAYTSYHVAASATDRPTDKEIVALWHQRLGHINMRDLHTLVMSNHVSGINVQPMHIIKHKIKAY
jgi:hypothetical protein